MITSRPRKPALPDRERRAGLLDALLTVIYPERCILCRAVLPGRPSRPLCAGCATGFSPAGQVCFFCEQHGPSRPSCRCIPRGYPIRGLLALSFYENRWREQLHNLKYHGKRSLARPLGNWLGAEVSALGYCRPDLVVPLPLHRNRERERGFNQSALIARAAAKSLGVPCSPVLKKLKDTPSQTRVSRRERRGNIYGAFSCSQPLPPGSVILLVDDIYSTGSTMREAAEVLKNEGAVVYGAVVAYNRRSRQR